MIEVTTICAIYAKTLTGGYPRPRSEEMKMNLFRDRWSTLDPHEIRILMDERFGGPGQYVDLRDHPNRLHLPLAGDHCQISVDFNGTRIFAIFRGSAFNDQSWEAFAQELDDMIFGTDTVQIGRQYAFSTYRVTGVWRGELSGIQLMPPFAEAAEAEEEVALHPFLLELPIFIRPSERINSYRLVRESRALVRLMNVVMAGRMSIIDKPYHKFWAWVPDVVGNGTHRWLQHTYHAPIGPLLSTELTTTKHPRLQVLADADYTKQVIGHDGLPLRVPESLEKWLITYRQLSTDYRTMYDRASYWYDKSSLLWSVSMSSAFGALVSAIEAFVNTYGQSTRKFIEFVDRRAPGRSEVHLRELYETRSDILHGSAILTRDQNLNIGWDPAPFDEERRFQLLREITRQVLMNWLDQPAPPYNL